MESPQPRNGWKKPSVSSKGDTHTRQIPTKAKNKRQTSVPRVSPRNVYIFDLETTGLFAPHMRSPISSPFTDSPEPVTMCWKRLGSAESNYYICKPLRPSTARAEEIHKITADIIEAEGVDTNEVLDKFLRDVLQADLIVGHNVYFDRKVVRAALLVRKRMEDLAAFDLVPAACTMLAGHSIFRFSVPGSPTRNKWPKLVELAAQVGVPVDMAATHDARYDVMLTEKCLQRIYRVVISRVLNPRRLEVRND